MIGSPIKVAGLGLQWSPDYARQYGQKLEELGYYTKEAISTLSGSPVAYVIYSYRPFVPDEARQVLMEFLDEESRLLVTQFFAGTKEGDQSTASE